jgi:enterochelin esterase family protein
VSGTRVQLAPSGLEGDELVFRQPDPDGELTSLRLWQELGILGDHLNFQRIPGGWELRLPRPQVLRLEYLFEGVRADGSSWSALDPLNPDVVPGAFGDKSWLALPGYREPEWLDRESIPWARTELRVDPTPVGAIDLELCEPPGHPDDDPLPLFVVHDGPEYARLASLTHYLGTGIASGALAPLRVALLSPSDRDHRYAANPDYAAALTGDVLGFLARMRAVRGRPVILGTSLGALAALHAEWTHPGTFAALMLQSGSFFTPQTDPQERGSSYFTQICRFVAQVHGSRPTPSKPSVPVMMTCGATEENVHCNRLMVRRLTGLGFDVTFTEHADVHNYTSWRDALDPGLGALLTRSGADGTRTP